MEIPREYIEGYASALNKIAERGRRGLKGALDAIDYGAAPAQVRAQTMRAMDLACGSSSEMAARTSAAFYDGLRGYVLGETMGARPVTGRIPDATKGAVRAFLKSLFDGDADEFERLCLDRVSYETKRAAGRCMQECVDADTYGDTRYARVPTGRETCSFCIMLASRGPVYHTPETAGAYDHYHPHCDCVVVPCWGTFDVSPSRRGSFTSIEGYDPDELYEQYCNDMLDPKFRQRMADASAHARGRASGHANEVSHPQLWERAWRDGDVTLRGMQEVENYILGAKTYEDLFDRIQLVSRELPYYGLSSRYVQELQEDCNRARDRILGVDREAQRRRAQRIIDANRKR